MEKQTIPMRVICVDLPAASPGFQAVQFGLQDKNKQPLLAEGVYEFDLKVTKHSDGTPNFTGDFAHGNRESRFL